MQCLACTRATGTGRYSVQTTPHPHTYYCEHGVSLKPRQGKGCGAVFFTKAGNSLRSRAEPARSPMSTPAPSKTHVEGSESEFVSVCTCKCHGRLSTVTDSRARPNRAAHEQPQIPAPPCATAHAIPAQLSKTSVPRSRAHLSVRSLVSGTILSKNLRVPPCTFRALHTLACTPEARDHGADHLLCSTYASGASSRARACGHHHR